MTASTTSVPNTGEPIAPAGSEDPGAGNQADDAVGADSLEALEASELIEGRRRRLDTIRAALLVVAGVGVVSTVAPWWLVRLGGQRLQVVQDGRPVWIELPETARTLTGLQSGELTRVVLVAAAAAGIWWALGRLWWAVAPLVLWTANPTITVGPPSSPPGGIVGVRSQLAELTSASWGLTVNRVCFYTMLCLVIGGGVQAFRVKSAMRRLDRAEGRPTGFFETRIAPRLAAAGITISVGEKGNDRT